jgi:hypothetical protein
LERTETGVVNAPLLDWACSSSLPR